MSLFDNNQNLRIDDKIGDENFDVINEKKKNGKNYKFGKDTKEKIFKYLYYRRFNYQKLFVTAAVAFDEYRFH